MVPVVDFENLAEQMLPSAQRLPLWKVFVKALISPIVAINQAFKDEQTPGTIYTVYDPIVNYGKGYPFVVVYKFKVYMSIISPNLGHRPDISPNAWQPWLEYAVPSLERAKFTCGYLTFTYAINRHFREYLEGIGIVGFRQPPYPAPYDFGLGGGTFSGIYVTDDQPVYTSLGVATASQPLGGVSSISRLHGIAKATILGGVTSYAYAIHMPAATWAALADTNPQRESIVRAFADTLTVAGCRYSITTY